MRDQAAASTGITAILGFKASQAAAKNARLTAAYNANIADNEQFLLPRSDSDEQVNFRDGSDHVVSNTR